MSKQPSALGTFFKELRRRKVFQVAVVYAVVGWILIQVADTIVPRLHLPDWTPTLVIFLVIIGFPIALIVAWAFELTPEGVKRTEAAEGELQEVERKTGLRIEHALIVLLAIAVAYLFYEIKVKRPEAEIAQVSAIRSIAVLPLENLSGDPEQDYFSDGMTEALIAELSQIGALRVISRTSVMQYKKAPKPIPQIAQELNVDAIVEGSVLRAGDRVRITAQLIKAEPEKHLWAQVFERDLVDVLALHSEVARAIAREIKIAVTPEEQERLQRVRKVNPEAYQLYLLGRHFFNRATEEGFKKGIEYFEQAIDKDTTYAPAYAGLANCYSHLGWDTWLSPEESYPKAREAAMKALELDEALGEAHALLGFIKYLYDWDLYGAEAYLQRAIELSPGIVQAHYFYSIYLIMVGRFDKAIEGFKHAIELDPVTPGTVEILGWAYYMAGRHDESIIQIKKSLELDPNYYWAHIILAWSYAGKGMYTEAIAQADKIMTLFPSDDHVMLMNIARVYGVSGKREVALRLLDQIKGLSPEKYVDAYFVASIYAGLGENDQAFEWLNKGYEERSSGMLSLKVHPFWNNLRDDPRFTALLKKMNLDN